MNELSELQLLNAGVPRTCFNEKLDVRRAKSLTEERLLALVFGGRGAVVRLFAGASIELLRSGKFPQMVSVAKLIECFHGKRDPVNQDAIKNRVERTRYLFLYHFDMITFESFDSAFQKTFRSWFVSMLQARTFSGLFTAVGMAGEFAEKQRWRHVVPVDLMTAFPEFSKEIILDEPRS